MTRYLLVAVALLVTIGGALRAFSNQDDRRIYGAGTNSCAEWTESRKGDGWITAGQWMLGYVSAANQFSKAAPALSDARSMARWLDDYCVESPEHDLSDATRALVDFLLRPGGR
jgi:hypothetical protein